MTAALATQTLPGALLDPRRYPHLPGRVELRETHISWVFLAGEKAYKVKKPVRFPFLDYGTLARRRACCHAEVALNRRFAPGRSIAGVVALVPRGRTGSPSRPKHDPRAVEYAVVMRRYDESTTLAARLAHGADDRGGPRRRRRRGRRLPRRRARSRHDAGTRPARRASSTRRSPRSRAAGAPARPARGARALLPRGARGASDPSSRERARRGLVRDGHGDLRAEHVLLGDADPRGRRRRVRPRAAGRRRRLRPRVPGHGRRPHATTTSRARCCAATAPRGGDPGAERCWTSSARVRALVRAKVDLLRAAQLTGARRRRTRTARGARSCSSSPSASPGARACRAWSASPGWPPAASRPSPRRWPRRPGGPSCPPTASASCAPASTRTRRAAPSAYGDTREPRGLRRARPARDASPSAASGGAIVDATFRRTADADAFAAASPAAAAAPPGSSARRRPRSCSSAPAERAARARSPTPGRGRRRRARPSRRPVHGPRDAAGPARHHPAGRGPAGRARRRPRRSPGRGGMTAIPSHPRPTVNAQSFASSSRLSNV